MSVEATAPGKVILFGEHSVVYNGPAIVIAIDRRAKITAKERDDNKIKFDCLDLGFEGYFEGNKYHPIVGAKWRGKRLQAMLVSARTTMEHLDKNSGLDLTVRSEIPIAAGLGSSAAICVSIVAATGALLKGNLSPQEICDIAYEGEKIVHGTPSGVDNNISTFGGILRFEKGIGIDRIDFNGVLPLVIGNSRRNRSTRKLIAHVMALRERNPELIDGLIDSMGEVSRRGLDAIKARDYPKIGDLMNINHGLLSSMGVSIAKLELLIHASRRAGAYGAKLTGAGGGGCMIAITSSEKLQDVSQAIFLRKGDPHIVKISYEGVKVRRMG
ncbi:MAG: mevalonate kinase [Candidatus Bathyarchaeota archaeon]|nr:mevalonate kinase [Candidatus Bathyarchaeota archaeon]